MLNKQPKISIIMPVYNTKEEWLNRAMKSILSQTLQDIEIILVNDGSKNNSPQVCDDYAVRDTRVRVIHQDNQGPGCARNSGLKIAKGKYILYVDADDWIKRITCEKLYNHAEENNLDVLFFGVIGFNEQENDYAVFDNFSNLPKSIFTKTLCYKDDEIINNLFVINHTVWSKLFRKDFLIQNDLYFTEDLQFEDSELFYRFIFKADKLGFIGDCLYFYRQNIADSLMGSGDKKRFDVLKVVDLIKTTLINNEHFEQLKLQYYNWKLPVINQRYKDIKTEFKNDFKKLITENLNRDRLTRQELMFLSKEAVKSYKNFMKKHYVIKMLFQKVINTANRKFKKGEAGKLVRVAYSWNGDDACHNWFFDDIKFTTEEVKTCDLLIVLNAPKEPITVTAKQAWCLTFEPPEPEIVNRLESSFISYNKVYTSFKLNVNANKIVNATALSEWWIGKTYNELLNLPILEKEDDVVWVTSDINMLGGHKKRLAFLKYVQNNTDYKIYGKGINPVDSKWIVYRGAKYIIGVENTFADDYWTEKLADSFLAYSMPIYYGCPNIEKYFPKEAMIRIDIEKPYDAIEIIRKAIEGNAWEKNFDAVVKARNIVLNELWYPKFVINEMKKIDFDRLDYKKIMVSECGEFHKKKDK